MLLLGLAAGIAALVIISSFGKAQTGPEASTGADGRGRDATDGLLVQAGAAQGQTVADLLEQTFSATATCRQACDVTTTVYLSLSDARRLGYDGAEPATPGVEVASSWAVLEAGVDTEISLVVNPENRDLLKNATSEVRLTGRVTAIDRANPDVQGKASWDTVLSGASG